MPPDREPNLENELRDLGPRIEYPPTPDLAGSVRARLGAEDESPAAPSGPSLWWLAAAALVVLAALPVLSLVVSGGMGGAGGMAGGAGEGESASSGEQVAGAPGKEPTALSAGGAQAGGANGETSVVSGEAASAYPASGGGAEAGSSALRPGVRRPPAGEGLGLGERIPLREARVRSEAPILLPQSSKLGEPDEIYGRGASSFTFLYRDAHPGLPNLGRTSIGLLLTQTPGDVGAAFLPRGTVEMAGLETVSVNGTKGYWISASGVSPEVYRSAGLLSGVLLWERDGQALRLEAGLSRGEAVRIAESVR